MFNKCVLFVCCVLAMLMTVEVDARKLPSYIKVCKIHDPHIDDCIFNSVESLRPKLIVGIPELNVPAIDPLYIPELVVAFGGLSFRAVGHNILVHGCSKYKVTKNIVDIKTNTFTTAFTVDKMDFEGDYEANLRLVGLPIVGKGPLTINATGVNCEAVLHGKRVMKDGVEVLTFPSIDIKTDIKNFRVRIEKLFPDKALTDATNNVINANSKEILKSFQPIVERTVSNFILDIANKITENIPYAELFPEE